MSHAFGWRGWGGVNPGLSLTFWPFNTFVYRNHLWMIFSVKINKLIGYLAMLLNIWIHRNYQNIKISLLVGLWQKSKSHKLKGKVPYVLICSTGRFIKWECNIMSGTISWFTNLPGICFFSFIKLLLLNLRTGWVWHTKASPTSANTTPPPPPPSTVWFISGGGHNLILLSGWLPHFYTNVFVILC